MRHELITFFIVGAAATLTHIGVAIFIESLLGFQPQLANLGGYVSAVGLSYFGHVRLTFRAAENHALHMPRFVVVSLAGLAIGSGGVDILIVRNDVPFVYAMFFIGIAVASTTFLLSKFWVFTNAQLSQKDPTFTIANGHGLVDDAHDPSGPAQWIIEIVPLIWFGLIILAVLGSFIHLDASSLWLDELFTVYFSDPSQSDFSAFLKRASEDVHPPVFYAFVWVAGRLTEADMPSVARGVGALSAALALLLIYVAMPNWVSRPARLFACTFAATSNIYFYISQEARSYAFAWIFVAMLFALVFGITRAAAAGKSLTWRLLAFTIVGIVASFSHYYLIPVAGAMVAGMMYLGRSWTNRIAIAVSGLAILAASLSFIGWHETKIVANLSDTWFKSGFGFLVQHTRIGLESLSGSRLEQLHLIILIAAGIAALGSMWIKKRNLEELKPLFFDFALVVVIAELSVTFAILVTLTYTPSYSFRFLFILAPVYWILSGFLFEALLRSCTKRPAAALMIFTTVIFAILSVRIVWRDLPRHEPWRETAEFVDTLSDCKDMTLPVVTFGTKYITESEPANFYGYYLKNGAARDWLSYSRDEVKNFPGSGRAREIIARRIAGIDPCPLLLWSVFHTSPSDLELARVEMEKNFDLPEGTSIIIKTIEIPESNQFMQYLTVSHRFYGYFLLVQR
ncbi:MAG: GtrA family protein [Sneathiella sp.]